MFRYKVKSDVILISNIKIHIGNLYVFVSVSISYLFEFFLSFISMLQDVYNEHILLLERKMLGNSYFTFCFLFLDSSQSLFNSTPMLNLEAIANVESTIG